MDDQERQAKMAELETLRARAAQLEEELAAAGASDTWVPQGYYATYHMMAGMVLGLVAAAASLLFNVIGSAMVGRHPLEIIRIYLTFPMGETALKLDSGFALAAGCCLYLATGMIGGIPFHMVLTRFFSGAGLAKRLAAATVLGLGVWLINFYGVLYWLQPLLIKGNWIVRMIPWYVAITTHLVFGWTILMVGQWGRFVPPTVANQGAATK